jgi:hypothetical protein
METMKTSVESVFLTQHSLCMVRAVVQDVGRKFAKDAIGTLLQRITQDVHIAEELI